VSAAPLQGGLTQALGATGEIMDYSYQAEKLSVARSCLMLPHSRGAAESIAEAFHNCYKAFHRMDESGLSDDARRWVRKIKEFMDTSGIDGTNGEGAWAIKAGQLTTDDQLELSRTIDELASWFDREFWSSGA
jgi:hypothetical protein